MNDSKKQEIALMKYQLIAPLVSGLTSCITIKDFFFEAADKGIKAPDGSTKHFSAATIERWYYDYKKNGFNALIPVGRVDEGTYRKLDDDIKNKIKHFISNYRRISSKAIYEFLLNNGDIKLGDISLSTVSRYVHHLRQKKEYSKNIDMRRYEMEHINQMWCGDTCVALWFKEPNEKYKKRVYIIALIDDASRFIVGIDLFFNDNFVNLMKVLKSAVSKYGRPIKLNFDNGSSYNNNQMRLLAARIGSVLHYDHPYSPHQKAKIERWFRTLKDHWVATLNVNDYKSLDDLRLSLNNFVQNYNNKPHSSLNGISPKDRYFSEPNLFKRLSDRQIEESFLLEIDRKVSADSIITIDNIEYEVDYKFAKQRIKLRYSPDLKNIFVVEANGILTPIKLLNKVENSKIKREQIHLSEEDDFQWTIPQDMV